MKFRKIISFSLALTLTLSMTGCTKQSYDSVTNDAVATAEEKKVITELRAQDDFYGYVNLDKLESMKIEWGESANGPFYEAQKHVDDQIYDIITEITEASSDYAAGSYEQAVRSVYRQYLDFNGPTSVSDNTYEKVFAEIDAASSVSDVADIMSELYRDYGVSTLIDIQTDADPFCPSENAVFIECVPSFFNCFSISDMMKNRKTSYNMKRIIMSLLRCEDIKGDEAEDRAYRMVNLLMDISRSSNLDIFDSQYPQEYYTKMTFEEADSIMSSVDLSEYIKNCGAKTIPQNIYVVDVLQLEALNKAFSDENTEALKDIAKLSFADVYGIFLPEKYSNMRNHYYSYLSYNPEKDAKNRVCSLLADEVGYLYADKYMTEDIVDTVTDMCEDMRNAYSRLIKNADWLTDETRELLCKKLSNFRFMIGAEAKEKRINNTGLIGNELFDTIRNFNSYKSKKNLSAIGTKHDNEVFYMEPQTINACYAPDNTITVPMGILNKPFFDPEASEAENLGAIGSFIAHEMSHAFDSNCIRYDADGNYAPEWLAEADRLAFEEKMKMAEDYYSTFTIMDVYHVDGELTLGENFADLGGVQCVLSVVNNDADRKVLMESYADIWCMLTNDVYALSCLRDDVHSPAMIRVNAVLSCFDEFYDIYDVNEGDGMYISPEKRIHRW